jgi:hypothetical protein
MATATSIEWTDASWNPVTGCTKISPGCKHCYAERMALRLRAMGQANYACGFDLTLQEQALDVPLRWRKPRRIFVNCSLLLQAVGRRAQGPGRAAARRPHLGRDAAEPSAASTSPARRFRGTAGQGARGRSAALSAASKEVLVMGTSPSICIEDELVIPAGIEDIEAFRQWVFSAAFPERGWIDYLHGTMHLHEGSYHEAPPDADGFRPSAVLGLRVRLRREPGPVPETLRFFVDERPAEAAP